MSAPSEAVKKLVLIVEDNPETRMFYRWVLEKAGFVVDDASNAGEAVAAVRRAKPSVVLLDLIVPDARGLRLAQQLQEALEPADVPIVAISGVKEAVDYARISGVRFAEYLQKPISPAQLIDSVSAHAR